MEPAPVKNSACAQSSRRALAPVELEPQYVPVEGHLAIQVGDGEGHVPQPRGRMNGELRFD